MAAEPVMPPPSSVPQSLSSTLPPQTTPFTPKDGAACVLSVFCGGLNYHDYTSSKGHLSGQICTAGHLLTAETEPGKPTPTIRENPECFPSGYIDLLAATQGADADTDTDTITIMDMAPPPTPPPLLDANAAYPGTACISGWTTACTPTIDGTHPQAWCCPPGDWSCALPEPYNHHNHNLQDQDQDQDQGQGGSEAEGSRPHRRCISILAEETDIWMAWDPPYTDASRTVGHWTAEVGAVPPQLGATVYRDVFPLVLAKEEGANTDGVSTATSTATVIAGGSNSPTDHPAVDPSDQTTSLTSGAKAGIAVGVLVSVFGILGFVVYFLCYRRKKRVSDRALRRLRAAREHEDAMPLEAIFRYVPVDINGGGGDGGGGGGRDGAAVLRTGEAALQVDGSGGDGGGGRSGNRNGERGFAVSPPVIRRGRSPPPVPLPAPPGNNKRRPPPRPPRPPRPSHTGVFETQM